MNGYARMPFILFIYLGIGSFNCLFPLYLSKKKKKKVIPPATPNPQQKSNLHPTSYLFIYPFHNHRPSIGEHPHRPYRNLLVQDHTPRGIHREPALQIFHDLLSAVSIQTTQAKGLTSSTTYPYCRPSSNPGSRSVLIILSSNLVPPIYFKQSSASWWV